MYCILKRFKFLFFYKLNSLYIYVINLIILCIYISYLYFTSHVLGERKRTGGEESKSAKGERREAEGKRRKGEIRKRAEEKRKGIKGT